jgi:hypothetical protein
MSSLEYLSKKKYERTKDPKTGKWTAGAKDKVAAELSVLPMPERFKFVAREVGVTIKSLHEKYDHLNAGMQAMALANVLRVHRSRS